MLDFQLFHQLIAIMIDLELQSVEYGAKYIGSPAFGVPYPVGLERVLGLGAGRLFGRHGASPTGTWHGWPASNSTGSTSLAVTAKDGNGRALLRRFRRPITTPAALCRLAKEVAHADGIGAAVVRLGGAALVCGLGWG